MAPVSIFQVVVFIVVLVVLRGGRGVAEWLKGWPLRGGAFAPPSPAAGRNGGGNTCGATVLFFAAYVQSALPTRGPFLFQVCVVVVVLVVVTVRSSWCGRRSACRVLVGKETLFDCHFF